MKIVVLFLLLLRATSVCMAGTMEYEKLSNILSRSPEINHWASMNYWTMRNTYMDVVDELLIIFYHVVYSEMPQELNYLHNSKIQPHGIGNFLGEYFKAVICAHVIGANFIREESKEEEDNAMKSFFNKYIPGLLVNTTQQGISVEEGCPHFYSDWEEPDSMLYKYPHVYQDLLRNAFGNYTQNELYNSDMQYQIDSSRFWQDSLFSHEFLENTTESTGLLRFPIIPDVAIHMRCGDLLGFQPRGEARRDHHMGFINFHHYLKIIPMDAQFIYVMTDPSNKATDHFFVPLIKGFVDFLRQHIRGPVIRVARGGKVFDAMAILNNAPISICAASTLCYFATVGAPITSRVYFPNTDLIAGATTPSLGPNFNWIPNIVVHLPPADANVDEFLEILTEDLSEA